MKAGNINIGLGLAAVIGIPALLLLQQALMPEGKPPVPKHLERNLNYRLLAASETGLEYGLGKAQHTAYAAATYFALKRPRRAESWFRLGAAEFRYPSLMHFYGDFLVWHGRYKEARRWYLLALARGRSARQTRFAAFVENKLRRLDALEKKK